MQTKKNKFWKNIGWMYGLKAVDYIFPLLLIPYLIRTIGVGNYGLLTTVQAFMGYLSIVVSYGFELTATRNIAIHSDDMQLVKTEFNSVMASKILIAGLVFFCLCLGLILLPLSWNVKTFYWIGFLLVIGDLLFPSWFFQGMQKLKFITILNCLIKSLYLLFVLLFVHTEADYYYTILCQGIAWVLAGVVSLVLIKRIFGFWPHPSFSHQVIWAQLKAGYPIFISNACGNIYGKGALILTGLVAGHSAAGYYALAEKICGTIASLVSPYVNVLYPVICQKYEESRFAFYQYLHKLYKYIFITDICLISILWICAGLASWIIQGYVDERLVLLIRGMSFVTVGTIINVLLHPFLLAAGKFKEIQRIYMCISVVFLGISIPFLHFISYWGMVISMIVVEYSISCYYIYQLHKGYKAIWDKE